MERHDDQGRIDEIFVDHPLTDMYRLCLQFSVIETGNWSQILVDSSPLTTILRFEMNATLFQVCLPSFEMIRTI